MGRKKITITPITNLKNRLVTFNKRKIGLLKKAMELSILCQCDVTLIIQPSAQMDGGNSEKVACIYQYSSNDIQASLESYCSYEGLTEVYTNAELDLLNPGKTSIIKAAPKMMKQKTVLNSVQFKPAFNVKQEMAALPAKAAASASAPPATSTEQRSNKKRKASVSSDQSSTATKHVDRRHSVSERASPPKHKADVLPAQPSLEQRKLSQSSSSSTDRSATRTPQQNQRVKLQSNKPRITTLTKDNYTPANSVNNTAAAVVHAQHPAQPAQVALQQYDRSVPQASAANQYDSLTLQLSQSASPPLYAAKHEDMPALPSRSSLGLVKKDGRYTATVMHNQNHNPNLSSPRNLLPLSTMSPQWFGRTLQPPSVQSPSNATAAGSFNGLQERAPFRVSLAIPDSQAAQHSNIYKHNASGFAASAGSAVSSPHTTALMSSLLPPPLDGSMQFASTPSYLQALHTPQLTMQSDNLTPSLTRTNSTEFAPSVYSSFHR